MKKEEINLTEEELNYLNDVYNRCKAQLDYYGLTWNDASVLAFGAYIYQIIKNAVKKKSMKENIPEKNKC